MAPEERILPIGYTGARQIVKRAGGKINLEISPHEISIPHYPNGRTCAIQ